MFHRSEYFDRKKEENRPAGFPPAELEKKNKVAQSY